MTTPAKPGKSKLRRAISGVILAALLVVIFLMFRKPAPMAIEQGPNVVAANSQSFQQKLNELAQPASSEASIAPAQVRFTSDEVQAALTESAGVVAQQQGSLAAANSSSNPAPSRNAADQASLPANAPPPTVIFENDVVRGQFQAEVAGQTVYVTVAGHLGAKDGYATFDPTEFKIGDLTVPVSMVNDQLQKKMAEQRDKLKLPDFIADLSVQNGELVIKRK